MNVVVESILNNFGILKFGVEITASVYYPTQ